MPRAPQPQNAPKLKQLKLVNFRPYPTQREFDFGDVNLIFGPNASGKTSVLEAIELAYCGRNNRNPSVAVPYQIELAFRNGEIDVATQNRKLQTFRDRNLNWYGQAEDKSNNLYQSFSRYNFLNTDAAIAIASSGDEILGSLSKLLIGPDAARIWHNMERVREYLRLEIGRKRQLQLRLEKDLVDTRSRLSTVDQFQPQSKDLQPRLLDLFSENRWQYEPKLDEREFLSSTISLLSELVAVSDQIINSGWINSPVTKSNTETFLVTTQQTVLAAEEALSKMQQAQIDEATQKEEIRTTAIHLELLVKAAAIVDANLPKVAGERGQIIRSLARTRHLLEGMPNALQSRLSEMIDRDRSIEKILESTLREKVSAEAELTKAERAYQSFAETRARSEQRMQQLRHLATELISGADDKGECPLCHTKFTQAELLTHIARDLDSREEEIAQRFLEEIRVRTNRLNELRIVEADCTWLRLYCVRASLPVSSSLSSMLQTIYSETEKQAVFSNRLAEIDHSLASLAEQGLSLLDLDQWSQQLSSFGLNIEQSTSSQIETIIRRQTEVASAARQKFSEISTVLADCSGRLTAIFPNVERSPANYQAELAKLKERLATTQRLMENLEQLSKRFRWPTKKPLTELIVAARTAQSLAKDLRDALTEEAQNSQVRQEAIASRDKVQNELGQLLDGLKKLSKAHEALDILMKEHSLSDEVQQAIVENQSTIEEIFTQIHSPREFSGIGSNLSTLVKAVDGSEVTLSQVSTGQRAAFALAIFLAQNTQLRSGPPVMLIDDPIAHVDDLNSLSFLDFLRDVSLSTDRQIFFATANAKLAGLFEKKFQFLSEDFKSIRLERDSEANEAR